VKRILIGAGLIVALAFAATAVASVRHYHGAVDEGGSVRFQTKVRHGETIKVKAFVFNHVPMECDNGASTVGYVGSPPPAMRVNEEHRFHGDFTSGGGHKRLRIRGRLRDHEQKARGTLRVTGDFAGGATNCDTGKVHWHARHGV
jgi:opacity protein-like surface antigen